MALIIKDRVKETTTTTGTGAVSLGGASAAFDSFQSVMSNGDTTFYAIVHTASNIDEWEVGLGTWNTGNTLTRTTVYAGSNGTSAVNFSSGDKDIFMTYPASKAVVAGEDVTFADITVTGTVDGVDIATNIPSTLGTAGQVLTVNSGGTAGEWADAGGGGATSVSSNGTGNIIGGTNAGTDLASDSLYNLFIGEEAGTNTTTGDYNIAFGFNALHGSDSTAMTGSNNIGIGNVALEDITTGSSNVAIGLDAGKTITAGNNNVTIGRLAGDTIATGNHNTFVGYSTDGVYNLSEQTAIGYNARTAATGAVAFTDSTASGNYSFAAAIQTNSSAYGSSGASSIAMGYRAKATGDDGVAIGESSRAFGTYRPLALGYNAYASQSYSIAIGSNTQATASNALALGSSATASGDYSIAIGSSRADAYYSVAIGKDADTSGIRGKYAFACGDFSFFGDAQTGTYVLRSDTTDATAEAVTTNKSTASTDNQIVLPNNSAYAFHGTIVARESATDGTECAAWKVEGLIRREGSAGTTVLVNSATTVLDNTPSWGMALSADTTNGGLAITVTGAASTNIRWVATIHTSEVTYA